MDKKKKPLCTLFHEIGDNMKNPVQLLHKRHQLFDFFKNTINRCFFLTFYLYSVVCVLVGSFGSFFVISSGEPILKLTGISVENP